MRRLTVLSMHTSPLAQPGRGDCGGMNVYVRQLSSALARRGMQCDVYTRAWAPDLAAVVNVEPGLRVHHVVAGPLSETPKEALPVLLPEFTAAVRARMEQGHEADAIQANSGLSGVVGHDLKHQLDLPLISTFHTLARVKAAHAAGDPGDKGQPDEEDVARRAGAEADIMACSDAVLASSLSEADQIVSSYAVDARRVEILAPGVDHALFSPGDRAQARRAVGLDPSSRVLLFAGRIQRLKGLDLAVESLARLRRRDAFLVVVGGPSGAHGDTELARVRRLAKELGLDDRVRFVQPQPHETLSTYYRAADVCLVPSRSESFGLVALEAAACGTPVIASAVGGLRSLVDDGVTGFLVDGRDSNAFASRIDRVLDEPGLAARLSLAAVARARRYTWSAAARRFQELGTGLTDRALVQC
jgi:D-inositol-3-phosphate glycosyltransferase